MELGALSSGEDGNTDSGVAAAAAVRNRKKSGGLGCRRLSVTLPPFPVQGDHNESFALLGELAPCGSTDKQTCLKTVVLLTDNKKNVSAPTHFLCGISGSCTPVLSHLCTLDVSSRWWPSNQVAVSCSMSWR